MAPARPQARDRRLRRVALSASDPPGPRRISASCHGAARVGADGVGRQATGRTSPPCPTPSPRGSWPSPPWAPSHSAARPSPAPPARARTTQGSSTQGSGTQGYGAPGQPPAANGAAPDPSKGGHVGRNGQRETLLTGDTAAKVKAAALAKVPGATVERVETDADHGSPYEAHLRKSDGTELEVLVDKSFAVTAVNTMQHP